MGTHRIDITLPGYEPAGEDFEIVSGETKDLHYDLTSIIPEGYFPTIPDLSTVTTEHPHLFFSEADLPRIRERYNTAYTDNDALYDGYYNYFNWASASSSFSDYEYREDDKAIDTHRLAFRYLMDQNPQDAELAYQGLMNIGVSRWDNEPVFGGILERIRALNNYVRAYDYIYNYIVSNHPTDLSFIEDLIMEQALGFVTRLSSDGWLQPTSISSERHETQMVIALVALAMPHYQKDRWVDFCRIRNLDATCKNRATFPDDAPPGWGSDIKSQYLLEYALKSAFGEEPGIGSWDTKYYDPDYFNAHFFAQKSRDGIEAGNAKEIHGQYLIYPFLFAWDYLFGPSNSLLYDLRAMSDANVEVRMPNGWLTGVYQELESEHWGHLLAGAIIADKYKSIEGLVIANPPGGHDN